MASYHAEELESADRFFPNHGSYPQQSGVRATQIVATKLEAVELAAERGLPLYIDELSGRRAAIALGLQVFGSLRVLRLAKEAGRISRTAPLIRQIREGSVYYSDELIARFLKEVGEL